MSENVRQNLERWNRTYDWARDGDEWTGQAELCGIPYEEWKQSLVRHLIEPYVRASTVALEIACGHGRWTKHLAKRAEFVIAVDLSPNCIEFCREKFRDSVNISYFQTPGTELSPEAGASVDVVWSYDPFVHMDREVIAAYLHEIRRVLKPGGIAVIHHANVRDLRTHRQNMQGSGWRSAMTVGLIRELAEAASLSVTRQFAYWDEERKIGVPRYGDHITLLAAS